MLMTFFQQAALVLQGTASVYCKKVDFLWGLLNKMIDMLHSKKGGDADGTEDGAEGGGGRRRRRWKGGQAISRCYRKGQVGFYLNFK